MIAHGVIRLAGQEWVVRRSVTYSDWASRISDLECPVEAEAFEAFLRVQRLELPRLDREHLARHKAELRRREARR